tara:strand:- start:5949 stop:6104 length:156 start_codon:yes stop_codon:yes gene_type:complete
MSRCTMCNVSINSVNTKGVGMGGGSNSATIRRCGKCYLKWKKEERRKNGKD